MTTRRHRPLSEFALPYLTAVITLILIVSLFSVNENANRAEANADELRAGLIANCEKNGNPLRDAMQALIRDQIEQDRVFVDSKQAALFFPNVPPEQVKALVKTSIQNNERLLESVPDVDCQALYPDPDEE